MFDNIEDRWSPDDPTNEDDFIVYLTGWSESTGHSMVAIYNDMTAKDRKWKNLDKLKAAVEG